MPSYGGSSHSYYNNRTSTQLGTSYGHGGSMRSYDNSGGAHMSAAQAPPASHPSYVPPAAPQGAPSSHFGGHYGELEAIRRIACHQHY